MFQHPLTANYIRQLLNRYQIDLIIVDEIYRFKQRGDYLFPFPLCEAVC
jgi:hypothetical protein